MFSKSTVKYIQSLQHKKFRDEYNVFVAEGPKVVIELLKESTFLCRAVYALKDWITGVDTATLNLLNDRIEIIKDFELEKIAAYSTANKVVAVFEKKTCNKDISLKDELTLFLDDIQDPGNLGTIIRTADWFGIKNIICSENTADIYNPKVVQATMASLARVNIVYVNLRKWLSANPDIQKVAAVLNGISLGEIKNMKEAILIIGNESKGISKKILELADTKITIPKTGAAESLNAAVATGILLYALRVNSL